MKKRYLTKVIDDLCFADHKMCLISGPRQCGKTTLGRFLLRHRKEGKYYNWDDVEFRRKWAKNPKEVIPVSRGKQSTPLIVLDEIHKDRRWKRTLKGIYDTLPYPCDILVTGSARLNVYRKGSDSLLGRYFHFRLHPFSLRETHDTSPVNPNDLIGSLFARSQSSGKYHHDLFRQLMEFGPFPEPLFAQNVKKARLWRKTRRELIIREDLRDISRIPELSRIELMVSLLPEKVGSLFSINSIREDMEVSHDTIKRWIMYLKELYYLFEIKPYHKSIPRALKKEGKIYFWDFGEIEDDAARFENLIANHLLKACDYWTDSGEGDFRLFYVRDKEKREIDFLIVKDGQPWLPVEAKLHDISLSNSWKVLLPKLPCKFGLQIVSQPRWEICKLGERQVLIVGAGEVLNYFP